MNTIQTIPTTDLVKANIQLELTKAGLIYQAVLQGLENIHFTRDNIDEMRPKLNPAERLVKVLNDRVNPYKEAWQADNAAKKSLIDPVQEVLSRKKNELAKIAKEIADEAAKIAAEKAKADAEEKAANDFFIKVSQDVSAATTDFEIIRIEKLIGAHSAKPLYKEKAESLKPIIAKQKEHIRELEKLRAKELEAEKIGDDEKIIALREQQEKITNKIAEGNETVQHAAIKNAEIDYIVVESTALPTIKAKRSVWTWELVDIEQAKKKANWTKTVTNDAVIDEYLKETKENSENEDFVVSGIRFFVKKSY